MELKDFIISNWTVILYYCLLVIPGFLFLWRLFDSAGEKGWCSLIPIYNVIILLKIVRLKWFFVFLYFLSTIFMFVQDIADYYEWHLSGDVSILLSNPMLIFVVYLSSIFFSFYVFYRVFVSIGKKPYDLMGFLFEVTILSPIVFLVYSDDLNYDSSELR